MNFQKGQTLVFTIVLLPLFILLCGLLIRGGRTLLVHQQVLNHCNKRILDALATQGKALSVLGKINPIARRLAIARKAVVEAMKASVLTPEAEALLIEYKNSIEAFQKTVATAQKAAMTESIAKSTAILRKSYAVIPGKKIEERYSPTLPLGPHRSRLTLHVIPEKGFETEIGPPLTLDNDFNEGQIERGDIVIQTEEYLQKWSRIVKAQPMTVKCEARIYMNALEDKKWSAKLVVPDKPL